MMPPAGSILLTDYPVTVCAECLTASCWHGEFMCERAKDARTTVMRASELRALDREHPSNFSPSKIRAVHGVFPALRQR